MTERIDAYTHVLTEPVLDAMDEVQPGTIERFGNAEQFQDIDRRLQEMDEYDIDQQVLTGILPMTITRLEPTEALEVTRLMNDEIRRLTDEHPDRFIPTATLPFLTGPYLDEFDRCVEELGMKGVQIWSNIDGRLLDDEAFHPFFEAASGTGVPVWIHPRINSWHDYDPADTWIYSALGWVFETTVALTRLVFNGVLERFQDLEVVSHHLGGFLPHVIERVDSFRATESNDPGWWGRYIGLANELPAAPSTYFDRVYADTAVSPTGKTHALECGLEFFGPDNLLYATDYPWGPEEGRYWLSNSIDAVEDMAISADTRSKIYGGNLQELLDI